jgi:hypothetical protein
MLFFYVWPLYNPVTAENMCVANFRHPDLLGSMLMEYRLGIGRLLCLEASS